MRDLARELGVSYPTAGQRFEQLLVKLELDEADSLLPRHPDATQ